MVAYESFGHLAQMSEKSHSVKPTGLPGDFQDFTKIQTPLQETCERVLDEAAPES